MQLLVQSIEDSSYESWGQRNIREAAKIKIKKIIKGLNDTAIKKNNFICGFPKE